MKKKKDKKNKELNTPKDLNIILSLQATKFPKLWVKKSLALHKGIEPLFPA